MEILLTYVESLSVVELALIVALLLFFIFQILFSLVLFRKPQSYEKESSNNVE